MHSEPRLKDQLAPRPWNLFGKCLSADTWIHLDHLGVFDCFAEFLKGTVLTEDYDDQNFFGRNYSSIYREEALIIYIHSLHVPWSSFGGPFSGSLLLSQLVSTFVYMRKCSSTQRSAGIYYYTYKMYAKRQLAQTKEKKNLSNKG